MAWQSLLPIPQAVAVWKHPKGRATGSPRQLLDLPLWPWFQTVAGFDLAIALHQRLCPFLAIPYPMLLTDMEIEGVYGVPQYAKTRLGEYQVRVQSAKGGRLSFTRGDNSVSSSLARVVVDLALGDRLLLCSACCPVVRICIDLILTRDIDR